MEKKRFKIGSISWNFFIETIGFFRKMFDFLSSLTSHPLCSIMVVSYSLILIYFPRIFLYLFFSPVLILTGILLSILLRLGTIHHKIEYENNKVVSSSSISDDHDLEFISCETEKTEMGFDKKSFISESFVEYWNVRAPLDVIYEEYEGQEEDNDLNKNEIRVNELAYLGSYFPESDTSSESDDDFPMINGWDSSENMCFKWENKEEEEDDEKEGLIEIELDGKRDNYGQFSVHDYYEDEEEDDDNLIEIEISPIGSRENWNFYQKVSDYSVISGVFN